MARYIMPANRAIFVLPRDTVTGTVARLAAYTVGDLANFSVAQLRTI